MQKKKTTITARSNNMKVIIKSKQEAQLHSKKSVQELTKDNLKCLLLRGKKMQATIKQRFFHS